MRAALALGLLAGAAACREDTAAAPAPAATPAPSRTAVPTARETAGQALVRRELRALEASFRGRIGAYAVDTATGATVSYRPDERFPLLSTFKALAAAAVLHTARTSDPGLMGRVVRWTAAEVKPNSPITAGHLKDGLTVARLCEAAITRSDNTAGNVLLKRVGGPAGLTRYLRSIGDGTTRLDRWETGLNVWSPRERRDTTTPAAVVQDLRALAVGDALTPQDRARLNGWLRATRTGGNRIRAGLPATWLVGDKTGTGPSYGTANDIALVRPGRTGAPIVMAVYTTRKAAGAPADEKVVAETAAVLARGLGRLA
ncbi:class A beta-lactamase BOR-1 [Microbispora corallina]|uniref:Beta-lactamase n=1 Tax=Microbispora corallina TaxID=83302 RepID=A0ABQ4G0M1_9ACTN|nr:class A beta-lactamase [Microbispora corallina]GIH40624.1 beta-lactamase [Microbispora corallina]